jgi:uncharacterized membrane protein
MNRAEFLNSLNSQLSRLSQEERNDILYDYEEHFSIGLEQGKTEEEIAKSLGDPRLISRQFIADSMVKQAVETKSIGSITRAVFAIAGLGFLNLIITVPIFFSLFAVLISLFAAAFSIAVSGLALILAPMAQPMFPDYVDMGGINPGVMIFSGVGLTSMGILFFIGVVYLSKYFFKGTISYLKMNMSIIKN